MTEVTYVGLLAGDLDSFVGEDLKFQDITINLESQGSVVFRDGGEKEIKSEPQQFGDTGTSHEGSEQSSASDNLQIHQKTNWVTKSLPNQSPSVPASATVESKVCNKHDVNDWGPESQTEKIPRSKKLNVKEQEEESGKSDFRLGTQRILKVQLTRLSPGEYPRLSRPKNPNPTRRCSVSRKKLTGVCSLNVRDDVPPIQGNKRGISQEFSKKPCVAKCEKPNRLEDKAFKCKFCRKLYSEENDLSLHLKKFHSDVLPTCQKCGKMFCDPNGLKVHEEMHISNEIRPFKCRSCNKSYKKLLFLQEHEKKHTGDRSHECDVCHKVLFNRSSLHRHLKIHGSEKKFKCGICKKTFFVSSRLRDHEKVHLGERDFKCGICNKAFFLSYTLKDHEKIHSGEKNFRCGVCEKTFIQSSNLRRHEKLIHAALQ